jgi:hypothetical protein
MEPVINIQSKMLLRRDTLFGGVFVVFEKIIRKIDKKLQE